MNKLSRMAIASLALVTVSAPASSAFMNNWQLSLDGGTTKTTVIEYLDFVGNSFIQNTFAGFPPGTPPSGTPFTFTDNGVFNVASIDGGDTIATLFPGYEMTAMFQNASGNGVLGGNLNFNPGATFIFYSDHIAVSGTGYGTAAGSAGAGIYGANNGNVMGIFTLTSGTGVVRIAGFPAGLLTLSFEAAGTDLTCGYWFDPNGNDLCGTDITLGFLTTNTSLIANASALLAREVVCDESGFNCPTGTPYNNAPFNILVSNNGQFRLETSEPGTIALLELGLAGLGLLRRFRRA